MYDIDILKLQEGHYNYDKNVYKTKTSILITINMFMRSF